MAGEWIKMRLDLAADPAVVRIRRATGLDADSVVGKLHRLWAWADVHTTDGRAAGLDVDWVDELVGAPGFGAAMIAAGWLEADADGITFTNFDRHNGRPAKVRALGKTRMKRMRCAVSATVAQPEEEKNKRREEEYIPAAPVPTSDPARPARTRAKSSVSWDADAGWAGITDADRAEWAAAYPGAVLDQELAKATAWLRANPKRCGKRNWRRFLVGWLQRCQDRGGTHREPGRRPADAPVDQAKRRFWRGDAAQNMTEAEYQAWRRDRRSGGVASALAASLRLKEEAS